MSAAQGVDAAALYEAAQDALSIDDFDSARLYLRQAVQLAPQVGVWQPLRGCARAGCLHLTWGCLHLTTAQASR